MALMTVVSFGRNRQNNETTVVSDTIFYSDNMLSTVQRSEASYYRLLMTEGNGLQKRDIFKDYYLNGQLKAVGGYSFIDLGNDNNTVLNGEVTTYYNNGKERWHGNFNNGNVMADSHFRCVTVALLQHNSSMVFQNTITLSLQVLTATSQSIPLAN
jgi:hypothetical protein